ncbi:PEP-CTERM sorting domain-containing protein [Paraglaciecola sp.]|uniref:Npun_F0296 family exosortase-dependent surface protein n=1 Tax=Paraglaciecola sp. TaxID=1920173 RepID=UPI0030F45C45
MKNILGKSKVFSAGLVLAMAMAGSASAATVTFGGQIATDGSYKTSNKITADNIITNAQLANGYFVETFDQATAIPAFPPTPNTDFNVPGASSGCAVNSPLAVTPSAPGKVNVRKGSVTNVAAAPAHDTTCYAYTTNNGSGTSYVDIDYTAFLASIGGTVPSLAGSYINYLGFYWGSVDTYNTFEFYSDNVLVKSVSGTDLLADLGGTSGDQVSDKSNVYVNIDFSAGEAFNRFRVVTSGIAGEFDNIVVGLDKRPGQVPAPTGLALLGLGLIGLGFTRRFKK